MLIATYEIVGQVWRNCVHIQDCKATLKNDGGSPWIVPVARAHGEARCQGVRASDTSEPKQIDLASYSEQELVGCLSLEISFPVVVSEIASSSNRLAKFLNF